MRAKHWQLGCDSPSVVNPTAKVRAKPRRPRPVVMRVQAEAVAAMRTLAEACGWRVRVVGGRG